jgi:prepilin signal peptidase PulO-like enzyme (type II secretory pathway)
VRRTHVVVYAFAAWTVVVWATRIRNILGDDAMERPEKVGRVGLSITFTTLGLAVAVSLWRRLHPAVYALVVGLAGWTTGVWVLMAGSISLDPSHSGRFKAIHFGLAAFSVLLGAAAVVVVQRAGWNQEEQPAAPSPPTPPASSDNGEVPDSSAPATLPG